VSPLRIGWAVSGGGAMLRAVDEASRAGLLPCEIVVIVADRPTLAERYAEKQQIPFYHVEPPASGDRQAFDREMASHLRRHRATWLALTFNRIIGPRTRSAVEGRAVNVHFSLLPRYPGFGGTRKALAAGDAQAGVTFHFADQTVDGGPILAHAPCPVLASDDEASLARRQFAFAVTPLLQLFRDADRGTLRAAAPMPADAVDRGPPLHLLAVDDDLRAFAEDFVARTLTPGRPQGLGAPE
jgi:phosphoribosylglycinamide formyltransferase-1